MDVRLPGPFGPGLIEARPHRTWWSAPKKGLPGPFGPGLIEASTGFIASLDERLVFRGLSAPAYIEASIVGAAVIGEQERMREMAWIRRKRQNPEGINPRGFVVKCRNR